MTTSKLCEQITEAVGASVESLSSLSGGCVGEVYRADLADGRSVVVKVDSTAAASLHIEALMLCYLTEHSSLPVPAVVHDAPQLLVMEHIEHDGRSGPDAELEAADALAALHQIGSDTYGFDEDTLIGGLHLPNPRTDDWPRFFAEHRLIDMARRCVDAGQLDVATYKRVHSLAEDIEKFIDQPQSPSLIHGDVWGGNVLTHRGHLAAFIDPAIYFADAEVELAFIAMFHTFGERFYDRYAEHRPIEAGFFEERRELYNLFPLLVHVRLFGGSYIRSLQQSLRRFGY